MDTMVAFYCDVLGFHVTNRGKLGDDAEITFISQDPNEHHQAFRVDSLDAVRAVKARLEEAGVEGVAPVSHGNAWSVYFTDPEGNGIECFTDTPFHVAQPYLEGLPIEMSNSEILEHTRSALADKPEFQPIEQYQAALEAKLTTEGR